MSALSYERHRQRTPVFIKTITLFNVALGMGLLLGWHQLAPSLEDPVLKLLGGDVGSDSSIFSYPFVVLWVIPFAAVAGTVLARSFDADRQARFIALFPTLLVTCSLIWLYLLSDGYS